MLCGEIHRPKSHHVLDALSKHGNALEIAKDTYVEISNFIKQPLIKWASGYGWKRSRCESIEGSQVLVREFKKNVFGHSGVVV